MPALVGSMGARAGDAYIEFLVATVSNANTRKAYARAIQRFSAWCERRLPGADLAQLRAVHVAAYREEMLRDGLSAATVKQALAAIRMLSDHLVERHVLEVNPAASVRSPKVQRRKGKTPVLAGEDARQLLDSFDRDSLWGLRNRCLVATMTYTFARVHAALGLRVGDYEVRGRRGYLALSEKGGKEIDAPCHHELDDALEAWLAAMRSSLEAEGKQLTKSHPLFPVIPGGRRIKDKPMSAMTAWVMLQSKAKAAGLEQHICNHTFRATGITAYLRNGGKLEVAQHLAGHADPSTTQLYDRRDDEVAVSEVERILL